VYKGLCLRRRQDDRVSYVSRDRGWSDNFFVGGKERIQNLIEGGACLLSNA
jgi:hypothetical protein